MTNNIEQQAVPVAQEDLELAREISADFGYSDREELWLAPKLARHRLASLPCKSGEGVGEGEAEKWRHKLWMVACHATGGGIPKIEGVDRSVNDICVQITQSRNLIYQAGKDAALTPDATQTREAELVELGREAEQLVCIPEYSQKAHADMVKRLLAALNARGGA